MTTPPPIESKQFRSSVVSLFIWLLMVGAPVEFCTSVMIGTWVTQAPNRILVALTFMAVTYPTLSLIGAKMLSRFCPTTISAEGVTTQSFTGGQRFVRWQDITTAKTLRVLNLKWILVYPAGESKAIQVPLFQPHKTEFLQEIQRLAPPGNPILNYL